jgi:hypothetical protein
MFISLPIFFNNFCKRFGERLKEKKLKWKSHKSIEWTNMVKEIFSDFQEKESYYGQEEYMKLDYVGWYPSNYQVHGLILAVEHESQKNQIKELVNSEIPRLINIKAKNKIAIFYPTPGDEEKLIEEISKKIGTHYTSTYLKENNGYISNECVKGINNLMGEKYLVILVYSTTKSEENKKLPIILLRGFFFNHAGEKEGEKSYEIKST